VKAEGADVRVVYSPLDALKLARAHRDRQVVFFGIGFETTAPANAMAVKLAHREGMENFSMLVSQVLVPPAIDAICASGANRVQGFLAAGHVCTVMGTGQYPAIAERFGVPIVVTGFEPIDLIDGIRRAVVQLERGEARVENAYARVVAENGNPVARALLDEVFAVTDQAWRGIGTIPNSGWKLAPAYRAFDAAERFDVGAIRAVESPECRSGDVLQGLITPPECPAFGTVCTPRRPLGATMVSSEGACAAYFLNGRTRGANAHA
jgi:hydrogenase expression/formation protein HypD